MSDIKKISTPNAMAPAGPYTQAVSVPNGSSLVFVSGQIPAEPSTGQLVSGSIGQKTAACCANVKAIVEAAGSSMERVVKVTVFLSDMAHFADMNAEYERWFVARPARSCVAVRELPKGVDVEIECIAALP